MRQQLAADLAARLAHDLERLCAPLGPPSHRGPREWRWGKKGALAVTTAGPHRGRWRDWESGQHGDALDLLARVQGIGRAVDAMREARRWLGEPAADPPPRPAPAPARDASQEERRRIAAALRIWEEAAPAAGSAVETYLAVRAAPLGDAADLRFHPRCPIGAERRPAMVALLRDIRTTEPCGIHRTFLRPDGSGKAGLPDGDKRILGRARGACVKPVPDEDVTQGLGIAEGIETALAVMATGWRPVWACLSAGNLGAFPVLAGIEHLTIFADNDAAGLREAERCAERWADEGGVVVDTFAPPAEGDDFNDKLARSAA